MVAEPGRCTECGKTRAIHKALGTKCWCKHCSHLAPPSPELTTKSPKDRRKRIKWMMGDKTEASEYKGTSQDE